MMDEFVKLLRHHIVRDANYVVSGSVLMLAMLYSFDRMPKIEPNWAIILVAAGFAYGVSYVLHEIGALLGLVTTQIFRGRSRLKKRLYLRFTGEEWQEPPPELKAIHMVRVGKGKADEMDSQAYERTTFLMHVGSANCVCLVAAFPFLMVRAVGTREAFDLFLAVGSLVLSVCFWIVNWIKAAQRTQLAAEWFNRSEHK